MSDGDGAARIVARLGTESSPSHREAFALPIETPSLRALVVFSSLSGRRMRDGVWIDRYAAIVLFDVLDDPPPT